MRTKRRPGGISNKTFSLPFQTKPRDPIFIHSISFQWKQNGKIRHEARSRPDVTYRNLQRSVPRLYSAIRLRGVQPRSMIYSWQTAAIS